MSSVSVPWGSMRSRNVSVRFRSIFVSVFFAFQVRPRSRVQGAAASCLLLMGWFETLKFKSACHVTKHSAASSLDCACSSRVDIRDFFSAPFSIPFCYAVFQKQNARFFAVRCKHAKPILLMRVETFKRRGSSPASENWENLTSKHSFLASRCMEIHAAWITEASLRNVTLQVQPSIIRVDGQEWPCNIVASGFIFSQQPRDCNNNALWVFNAFWHVLQQIMPWDMA